MSEAWPEGIYNRAKIKDLILVALSGFKNNPVEFEELLARCFKYFPNKFSFTNHSQWPDSRRLDRTLRSLRDEGFLDGDPEQGYILKKKGQKKASAVSKSLRQSTLEI